MYIADESEQLQYSDCQFSNVDLELSEEVTSRHLGRARAASSVNVRHCTIAWAIDVAKDKHVEGHVGNVHVMKGSVTRMAAGIIVEHEPSPVRQIGVATRIWSGHARVALRTKRTAQRW